MMKKQEDLIGNQKRLRQATIDLRIANIDLMDTVLRVIREQKQEFREEIEERTKNFFKNRSLEYDFDLEHIIFEVDTSPAKKIWISLKSLNKETQREIDEVIGRDLLDFEVLFSEVLWKFGISASLCVL